MDVLDCDRTARVWDAHTGASLRVMTHAKAVRSAHFTRDGSAIVTVAGKIAYVWREGIDAPIVLGDNPGDLRSAEASDDGARVVTAGVDGSARAWDAHTGALLATFPSQGTGLSSAIFDHDGELVVTAGWDYKARVWEVATGKLLATTAESEGALLWARFLPRGWGFATFGAGDKSLRTWNLNGTRATTIGSEPIAAFDLDPFRGRVATGSHTGEVLLWNLQGVRTDVFDGGRGVIQDLAFSSGGRRLAALGEDGSILVWRLEDDSDTRVDWTHAPATGELVVVHRNYGALAVVERRTERLVAQLPPRFEGHALFDWREAVVERDQQHVLIADGRGQISHWELATGVVTPIVKLHGMMGMRMLEPTLSPHGRRLLLKFNDDLSMYDATGKRLSTASGIGARYEFDASETRLLAVQDRAMHVLSADDLSPVVKLQDDTFASTPNGIAWSPAGDRVAAIEATGRLRVWRASDGALLVDEHTLSARGGLVFRPDGGAIVVYGGATLELWDARTGKILSAFRGHAQTIASAQFSVDGERLVSAAPDKVIVWDTTTGQIEATFPGNPGVEVAFTPDGRNLYVNGHRHLVAADERSAAELARLAASAPYALVDGMLVPRTNDRPKVTAAPVAEEPLATGCATGLRAEGAAYPRGIELSCRDADQTLVRQERWWPNGLRMSLLENGVQQVWDLQGRLIERIERFHEIRTEVHGNTSKSEEVNVVEGENMTVTNFGPSGLPTRLVDYRHFRPSGRWRSWYPNGQLRQDGVFSCEKDQCVQSAGAFVEYYADGRKAAEGHYTVNYEGFYKVGDWTILDLRGVAHVEHHPSRDIMTVMPAAPVEE
jgi:WD40 repeat protein